MGVVQEMREDKGLELADILNLKARSREGSSKMFHTDYGPKTAHGLYLTVKAFIEESEDAIRAEDSRVANYIYV